MVYKIVLLKKVQICNDQEMAQSERNFCNVQRLDSGMADLLTTGLHLISLIHKKVQVGKDQEKAQSEKDSHSVILVNNK